MCRSGFGVSNIHALVKAFVAMTGMSAIMAMVKSIVAMSPWLSIVAMIKSIVGPQVETASVVTHMNTELAEKEESARIISELIARHEDEKDKIRAASMRQEDLLSLVRHEMAALGANVNDRMQMMTRNTLRMADCNAQLIMATRPVVEQNQVSVTPGKLNPSFSLRRLSAPCRRSRQQTRVCPSHAQILANLARRSITRLKAAKWTMSCVTSQPEDRLHTFAQLLANEDISSSILLQLTHADMLRLSQICKAAQAATLRLMGWMVRRLLTELPVRNVLPEGVRPDRVLIDI